MYTIKAPTQDTPNLENNHKPKKDVINKYFSETLRSLHETQQLPETDTGLYTKPNKFIVLGIQMALERALEALIMNCVIYYGYTVIAHFESGFSRELEKDNYWRVIANFYKTTKIEVI
jgi:hypothetical protein